MGRACGFRRATGTASILLLALASAVSACNVPVFRYALEKWQPAPYELTIVHRGPLQGDDKALVETLRQKGTRKPPAGNFSVETIDLDGRPEAQVKELLDQFPDARLPLLLVRYPMVANIKDNVHAGRLDATTVKVLLDSPARRELIRRLSDGDSAVWVLLESGDRKKDEAAAALLQTQLKKLQTELKLPELTDAPEDKVDDGGPPLKLAFSSLRVDRKDPAERLFVQMLLHSEEDLADRTEPMVFPVFGRGRVPFTLVGKGVGPTPILKAAQFMIGKCTCTIRDDNPGVDLLLSADWDHLRGGHLLKEKNQPPSKEPQNSPPPPKAAAPAPPVPWTPAAPAVKTEAAPPAVSSSPLLWVLLGAGTFGLLLMSFLVLVRRNGAVASDTHEAADTGVRARSDAPFYAGLAILGGTYVLLILALVVAQASFTSADDILAALASESLRFSIVLSLVSCSITAILSVWVGVALGYVLSRFHFPGKALLDAVLDIPIVLPPLVIGLGLLILFQTPPGRFFTHNFFDVGFAVPGVILAQFMVACAFAVRTMRVAFDQINPRQEQVALTLGCNRGQAFWWVVLPQARRGIVAAATISWARALGEFGPILIFVGATPLRTEVLPTTIYLHLSVGKIEAAAAVSLLMIVAASIVLVIFRARYQP